VRHGQTGLKFVQFQKNSSFHSGINQLLFECLFGVKPHCGLRSTPLPDEVLQTVITEDDLARIAQINAADVGSANPSNEGEGSSSVQEQNEVPEGISFTAR